MPGTGVQPRKRSVDLPRLMLYHIRESKRVSLVYEVHSASQILLMFKSTEIWIHVLLNRCARLYSLNRVAETRKDRTLTTYRARSYIDGGDLHL